MRESQQEPLDVDVADLDPGEFARLLISRSLSGNGVALVENQWDVTTRYPKTGEAVQVLTGIVEQLLGWLGEQQGLSAALLWQDLMLREAASEESP